MRLSVTPYALGLVVVLAGCATTAQGYRPEPADSAPSAGATSATHTLVPQVGAMSSEAADRAMFAAGLVPILRYEPGVLADSGKVLSTSPAAGSQARLGDEVTVMIAGSPGNNLTDYVRAHRERYVGVGVDTNGVTVVAVHESADLAREMGRLGDLTRGAAFRVQSCARSWVALQRVQLELSLALTDDAYPMTIDPLACAVRLTGELADDEVAELAARYRGALVIQQGTAQRAVRSST